MRTRFVVIALLAAVFGSAIITKVLADLSYTQGAGTTIFDFICFTTKHCSAHVPINSSGTELMTSANPATITLSPSSPGIVSGQSNASSGVATGGGNLPSIAYLYGFNGTSWDQLQVDGSKNLKVTSAGSQSNASSGVATSSTNAQSVVWLYAFNGSTWDQLKDDGNQNLNVNINANSSITVDPCQKTAKLYVTISQTSSTQLISGTSAKNTYVCSIAVNGSDAEDLSLVEGTGSVCATNTYALIGSTTAAAGMNFAANSGIVMGNGMATVTYGSGDAHVADANICLLQSGTGRVAGVIGYVQQ